MNPIKQKIGKLYVRHFANLASWFRGLLNIGVAFQRLFGAERCEAFSRRLRQLTKGRTPVWLSTLPAASRPVYARNELIRLTKESTVVYWPSCVSQSFGSALNDDRVNIPNAVQSVLNKANLNVVYPQPTRGLCCGAYLRHKGLADAADQMQEELISTLWEVSSAGRYPVLADTSACSEALMAQARARGIHLYESSEFIDKFLLDRLDITPEIQRVAVFVSCATRQLGVESSFYRVVDKLTPDWVEPDGIDCCGSVGDQAFTQPERAQHALAYLPFQIDTCAYGISNNRMCEISLSRYGELTFYSLFEILDRCSQGRQSSSS
ncbi:(Fe-S)-binding protein [Reinekea thalattae]|uniref:(Fe-S)-binding protein n=1 Tax=Reinekea thalattae TaxID=2593301 RepID=A0A5C8Z1Y1_9GAMM|nr:(Fe-S)-binding protein [Reinekea thalattae]TXR52162.1 (Fe-S)-binding protein [Reinekea thalattae]